MFNSEVLKWNIKLYKSKPFWLEFATCVVLESVNRFWARSPIVQCLWVLCPSPGHSTPILLNCSLNCNMSDQNSGYYSCHYIDLNRYSWSLLIFLLEYQKNFCLEVLRGNLDSACYLLIDIDGFRINKKWSPLSDLFIFFYVWLAWRYPYKNNLVQRRQRTKNPLSFFLLISRTPYYRKKWFWWPWYKKIL